MSKPWKRSHNLAQNKVKFKQTHLRSSLFSAVDQSSHPASAFLKNSALFLQWKQLSNHSFCHSFALQCLESWTVLIIIINSIYSGNTNQLVSTGVQQSNYKSNQWSTRRKNSQSRVENQQTQPTYEAESRNPGHFGGRQALSPLCQPCSPFF